MWIAPHRGGRESRVVSREFGRRLSKLQFAPPPTPVPHPRKRRRSRSAQPRKRRSKKAAPPEGKSDAQARGEGNERTIATSGSTEVVRVHCVGRLRQRRSSLAGRPKSSGSDVKERLSKRLPVHQSRQGPLRRT